MIKNDVIGEKAAEERRMILLLGSVIFPFLTITIAVLLGGVLGSLDVSTVVFIAGAILLVLVLALRQYGLAVALIIFAHIYIDWYLGLEIVVTAIAVGLFFLLCFIRSPEYPRVAPRSLWLWGLLLIIGIPPAIRGAQSHYDLAFYYPNIFLGALLMYWLGMLVASNRVHLRTFFQILSTLGAFLAIHTIIQNATGTIVFGSAHIDAYLTQVSHYDLTSYGIPRPGSFLINPDWNGTFFAMLLFLPIGLFAEATSFIQKILCIIEVLLMSIALLLTYSIGAWIGFLAGIIVFMFIMKRGRYLIRLVLLPVLLIVSGLIIMIAFPAQLNLQFQHLSNPTEVSLRVGAWQTAINIIHAFPLTGIGLGLTNYLQAADPYRVPAQYLPLSHPHNSYLELGAMAGLPVLIVFLALLLVALWQAWRNWRKVDAGTRFLLGGGIAAIIALSVNSMSINAWTLSPLAAIGWVILGAMSSPLLATDKSIG